MKIVPLLTVLLLSACAAPQKQNECTRSCNTMHDSCMDAAGSSTSSQANAAIERQCASATRACLRVCPQP